jgi:lipoate synthase
MDLISDFKDDSTIVHFRSQFEALKKEYDKITINVNTNGVEIDTANQITTIDAVSKVTFTNENLEAIRKIISDIRTEIIQ